METTTLTRLRTYLANATKEEFEKSWAEVESMNFKSPTVEEFVTNFEFFNTVQQKNPQPLDINSFNCNTVFAVSVQDGIFSFAA